MILQTSMYRYVYEASFRGESSNSDNEDECNVAKGCCDGAVG